MREQLIWPPGAPETLPGIEFRIDAQLALLDGEFSRWVQKIDLPADGDPYRPEGHFYGNDQFPCPDAEVLFCMLGATAPRHVIEVGPATLLSVPPSSIFASATVGYISPASSRTRVSS